MMETWLIIALAAANLLLLAWLLLRKPAEAPDTGRSWGW